MEKTGMVRRDNVSGCFKLLLMRKADRRHILESISNVQLPKFKWFSVKLTPMNSHC